MTKKQAAAFYRELQFLDGHDLLKLKQMVEDQIEYARHLKENFYLNDKLDNYLYIVRYNDGEHYCMGKGSEAYNEYVSNPAAVRLERKTKDLFPTFELLMEKGNEPKGIHSKLSQNETEADKVQFKQRTRCGHHIVPRA